MRILHWTAAVTATAFCLVAAPATASQADSGSTDQTILVTFDSAQTNPVAAAKAAVTDAGGQVASVQQLGSHIAAVTVTGATAAQATQIEAKTTVVSGVKVAESDGKVYPTAATNDTYYDYLWNVSDSSASTYGVDAQDAWTTSAGSGAVIAVLDTGITSNVDLNSHVIAGYDFISNDTDPTDEGPKNSTGYHGTLVAGVAAAIANNSAGVFGVAPGASIEPIRIMDANGATNTQLIRGILWASTYSKTSASTSNHHKADVINLSLAGDGSCPTAVQTAINEAVSEGTAVVVAAGNGDSSGNGVSLKNTYPANCKNVIRVVATRNTGKLASYSNYGTSSYPATIAAPGGSASYESDPNIFSWILSTWPDDTYHLTGGTSMATPHVSGVVALLRAASPSLTVSQITAILKKTAEPLANACSTSKTGAGIVDAAAAVAAATSTTSARTSASGFSLSKVTISGTKKVGKRLSAKTSSSPAASALTYQWLRNGVAISGATKSTYKLAKKDKGTKISVTVIAECASRSATKTSAGTTKIK